MGQEDSQPTGTGPLQIATVALDLVAGGRLEGNGVHWTFDESEDLNINLVHLDAFAEIAPHTNTAVDVVIVVLQGTGRLAVDGMLEALDVHTFAHVARGAERSIHADHGGVTYLTVHRRQGPLGIEPRSPRDG